MGKINVRAQLDYKFGKAKNFCTQKSTCKFMEIPQKFSHAINLEYKKWSKKEWTQKHICRKATASSMSMSASDSESESESASKS